MKKLVIFVVLLALAAVAVWYVRPAYRAKKEQRFAAQARMQLTNGEPRKAVLSARQTLALNSNNVTACQVMADLADMGRSPGAIVWRRRLAELQPTLENKAILAACALRYEKPPFPVTAEVLKEMESASKDFTPFHLVSAQMALKLNRRAEAEKHFEESIRLEPTNVLHRLNLAVVRLQSSDAKTSAAARAVLEGFQSDASWGAHALRSLAALELGKRAYREARDYSSQLLQKPQVTFADKLQHLTILHHAKDAGFDSFRRTLQGQAQTNAVLIHELAVHLVNLGRPAEALAWIKGLPGPIQNEQPVPLATSACYSAQKNWRGLEDYLNGQKWTEQEFIRLALLAHAVRSQGEAEVARAHWNRALQVASERPELLGILAQTANGWGWSAETEDVLWRAAKGFPQERWALDSLHATYAKQQNARGLYNVYVTILEHQSTNAIAQNNVAALGLLLGTNTAKAHELAKRVYEIDPKNYGFVSTYAYSLHLQGKTAEGLKLMETLSPEQLDDPSLGSYYGVLLAAAGQKEKARLVLARSENAKILPEEKKMAADALRNL